MADIFQTRRNWLLGGAATLALALGTASPAFAQVDPVPGQVPPGSEGQPDAESQDPESEDTITVTGFRAALQSAARQKQDSDLIVESVSAEEIGRLPDNSIAESIARLPGLTAQRLDGRAQVISIRGFAPDFSTTLLNGREQVTSGDNRGVEFDQYPSEVMNQVLVYKTPNASLIGQGLSGTVDLRTIRPLTYGRRVLAIGARGEQVGLGRLNAGSNERGYRLSATYVDQFNDDSMGLMLGIARIDSPSQIERFNAWGYPADPGANVIGGSKPYVVSTRLRRTAAVGSFEWEMSPTFTMVIDSYYSRFDDEQIMRGIELPLFWSGAQLQPGFTVEDGLVTSGQFNNVVGVVRNDANRREADIWSIGWNGRYEDNGWIASGDISFSGVDREDLILETYSGTGRGGLAIGDNIGFTMTERGAVFSPTLDYSNPNLIRLTSPQGWGGNIDPPGPGPSIVGGQDGYYNNRTVNDELSAFRVSLEREIGGFLRSAEIGFNFTGRDKRLTPDEFFLGLVANTNGTTSVPIPQDALLEPTNLGFLGLGPMVSYDPIALLNSGIYNLVRNPNSDVSTKGWRVSEDVMTFWGMLNLNGDLGGSRLTGNVGVQLVLTDQGSVGTASSGAPAVLAADVRGGDTYTEILPSMNLVFRATESMVFRLGAARQLARPRLDEMRASSNFGFNETLALAGGLPFSGSGGNPRLRPWIANAVDLSAEYYLGGEGYLAAAVFYKDLQSYIFEAVVPYDFSGFPVPTGITLTPAQYQGFLNIPQNGEGGTMKGVEVSGTIPFRLLSSFLDGFGITGSVSYTDSNVRPNPGSPPEDLPGYSRWVANGTAYYENSGFSIRGSVRHRSSFLGELRGFGGGNERRRAAPETVIDGQIGYEFQNGAMQGLTIIGQVTNITDEPFVTFDGGDPRRVIDHHRYGRRYMLGINFRM